MGEHATEPPSLWRLLCEQGLELVSSAAASDETSVIFRLGEQHYRLPAHQVQGIQPLGFYTPVPFSDDYVVGVIKEQARQIVVLDVRPMLGQNKLPPLPDASIILLKLNGLAIGLLADGVLPPT